MKKELKDNWYKKAQVGSVNFTDEEFELLVDFGENLQEKDRQDGYVERETDYHVPFKGNMASFKTEGKNAIDTQYERYWEPFNWEGGIEKLDSSHFYVTVNDEGREVPTIEEALAILES